VAVKNQVEAFWIATPEDRGDIRRTCEIWGIHSGENFKFS